MVFAVAASFHVPLSTPSSSTFLFHGNMIAAVLLTMLGLPCLWFFWSALSLQANKAKAETTGLPLMVRWVTPTNPFWMMVGSSFVLKCRALGIGTKYFHRFYIFGWEANERHVVHQELGPAFMLVSPGGNWLCVSDASIFTDVIHRRTDFRRNMEQFAVLNVYGKNLSTTDDEEWQKHRKVTAITFTENNNKLVWEQSLLQTRGMLQYWLERQPVNTTNDDTKVFTLNVLAAAIFDKSYPFEGAAESKTHISTQNGFEYRDSLGKILKNIIPIFIFGEQGLKAWWTPHSWKSAGLAIDVFRSYVTGLINEEREHMDLGVQKNQHLVAALVCACESEQRENGHSAQRKRDMTLTEEEIISNLFVYAFAGNDTTAIALNHLLVDLAASPETQEWIAEEIRHYLPEDDLSQWPYKTFPHLKRCLAVVVGQ
jgi:cytochrome P450